MLAGGFNAWPDDDSPPLKLGDRDGIESMHRACISAAIGASLRVVAGMSGDSHACQGKRPLFLNSPGRLGSPLLKRDGHGAEHDEHAQECGGCQPGISLFRERSLGVGERKEGSTDVE